MPPSVQCPCCTRQINLDLLQLLKWKTELEKQPGAIESLRALLPANMPEAPSQPQTGPVRSLLKDLGFGR